MKQLIMRERIKNEKRRERIHKNACMPVTHGINTRPKDNRYVYRHRLEARLQFLLSVRFQCPITPRSFGSDL